jgi:hypothetical protein
MNPGGLDAWINTRVSLTIHAGCDIIAARNFDLKIGKRLK